MPMAIGVTWAEHFRNLGVYGRLPQATDKVQRERGMRLAGECVRHPELVAS